MSDRREFRDLTDVDTAREIIEDLPLSPGTTTVPLGEASGRILAERVDATMDVPGFDRATMDGYALRGRDTFGAGEMAPVELSVVGTVHAGEAPDVAVDEGEAVEISTGAVMPAGADAMVPIERIEELEGHRETKDEEDHEKGGGRGENGDQEEMKGLEKGEGYGEREESEGESGPQTIAVRKAVAPGDNVMRAGTDVAAGERMLGPGTRLTAREIGLLSALGVETVTVRRRPRVGIISTGDELVPPGETLTHDRGEIHDVNTYSIAAAVEAAGGTARQYPHCGDDYEAMESRLRTATAECDLVMTSGSTSASAVDVVYRVIEDTGELLLHGIALKPGKPTIVGTMDDTPYIGLPGYPVSAAMVFRTLVAPRIREAAGLPEPQGGTVTGEMAVEERFGEGRRRLLPVGITETGPGESSAASYLVYPVDKGSGATTSLALADGLVTVPADTDYLAAGESVTVELFDPDGRPPDPLCAGEDDPVVADLLDKLPAPRFLSVGSREGIRRFRDGIPDVVVTAGPLREEPAGPEIGGFEREWGLVVPEGNPEEVTGVGDLIDRDLSFINRTADSGLYQSLEAAIEELAAERGSTRSALSDEIRGFTVSARAHESPARSVAQGSAAVGLGLRATAEERGLGFVSLGTQPVRIIVAPERAEKAGVQALEAAFDEHEPERPGYTKLE